MSTYTNNEARKRARKKYRRKYYAKTYFSKNYKKPWNAADEARVLTHDVTDTQLAREIGRSVSSIQAKRRRLLAVEHGRDT